MNTAPCQNASGGASSESRVRIPSTAPEADPRHVFLDARSVMRRYGWGKTKGYQNLKDRELVPPPVMRHPDRWRLDQLLAWEDRRMAVSEAGQLTLTAVPPRQTLESRLPAAKRSGRRSA